LRGCCGRWGRWVLAGGGRGIGTPGARAIVDGDCGLDLGWRLALCDDAACLCGLRGYAWGWWRGLAWGSGHGAGGVEDGYCAHGLCGCATTTSYAAACLGCDGVGEWCCARVACSLWVAVVDGYRRHDAGSGCALGYDAATTIAGLSASLSTSLPASLIW